MKGELMPVKRGRKKIDSASVTARAEERGVVFVNRFLPALMLGVFVHLAGVVAPAQGLKPQPSARDLARRVRLRCSPRRVRPGGALTLDMSVPHGRDLAVLSPAGRYFFLRSGSRMTGGDGPEQYGVGK
jgi:hypothetical protein